MQTPPPWVKAGRPGSESLLEMPLDVEALTGNRELMWPPAHRSELSFKNSGLTSSFGAISLKKSE